MELEENSETMGADAGPQHETPDELVGKGLPLNGLLALRDAVGAALADGLTQANLARQAGLSAPMLSAWLKGAYKGNNDALQSRLAAWVATRASEAQAMEVCGPDWVQTPTGLAIERALMYARTRPAIAAVYGGAGVGKTTALRRFAAAVPNVWIVTASPAVASMAAMLREIGAALQLHGSGWQNRALSRDIKRAMTGTRGLLVIDEAQHLKLQALEEIRAIHDATQVGLVLSGNESVYTQLTGSTRRAEFAQLFSRVGRRVRLSWPTPEDVDAILLAWGITGAKEREFAQQIASMPGGLRGLAHTLEDAATAARGFGRGVDVKMMRTAWNDLGAMK